jgi:hypothetical protein
MNQRARVHAYYVNEARRRALAGHPNDIPGHLTRAEVWSRITYGLLIGVSLGVATFRIEHEAQRRKQRG